MTDRHCAYVITLDQDIREDDAEAIINAIQCLKHVLSVQPVVADIDTHIARQRVRQELGEKLWEVLYPKDKAS